MAPMEPWQRVWIDAETYAQDVHSYIACTICHGGQPVDDMTRAHTGLIDTPAADPATCGDCHPDVTPANGQSLHTRLHGYDTALHERTVPENHPVLEEMQANHCNDCHTSCADCHISQPASVGGGLLRGHTFVETPPMSNTCTACHGSRVKNEYFGLNEGFPADVHFRARMACVDCHTADEIHGVGMEDVNHRYDGAQVPDCESCHQDQIGVGSGIEQHEIHGTEILSCQSCHSTEYTTCVNCHVEQTDEGVPFYRVESHSMDFVLGRNPLRSAERPYRYVTLRHVPIDIDSFSFYGDNLLPNFDQRETWTYSTPHNIQRNTPQTESCENCHGNDDIFLTRDKVVEEEWAANAGVMVEGAPPLPAGYAGLEPEAALPDVESSGDGFWGDSPAATPTPADSGGFWGDAPATAAPAEGDFWGGGSPAPEPTEEPTEDAESFWGSN